MTLWNTHQSLHKSNMFKWVCLTMLTSKEQRRCLCNCVLCSVSYHTDVCVSVFRGWFTLIYMEQQRNTECSFSHNAPKGTTFAHIPLWEHIALAVGKWVSIKLGVTLRPALLMKKEWKKKILMPGLSSAAQAKPQTQWAHYSKTQRCSSAPKQTTQH